MTGATVASPPSTISFGHSRAGVAAPSTTGAADSASLAPTRARLACSGTYGMARPRGIVIVTPVIVGLLC
jgi:hypothetical protein